MDQELRTMSVLLTEFIEGAVAPETVMFALTDSDLVPWFMGHDALFPLRLYLQELHWKLMRMVMLRAEGHLTASETALPDEDIMVPVLHLQLLILRAVTSTPREVVGELNRVILRQIPLSRDCSYS